MPICLCIHFEMRNKMGYRLLLVDQPNVIKQSTKLSVNCRAKQQTQTSEWWYEKNNFLNDC
jgi:hypothetical protein